MLNLPSHLSISITHNEHKLYYQSVEEYFDECNGTWIPGDSRSRAIADDELWTVQVYPRTPVGFYVVVGRTLEEILDYLNETA